MKRDQELTAAQPPNDRVDRNRGGGRSRDRAKHGCTISVSRSEPLDRRDIEELAATRGQIVKQP